MAESTTGTTLALRGAKNIQYTAAMAYPTTLVFYSTSGLRTHHWQDDSFINWLYYVLSRTNVPQTITISYGWVENITPPDHAIYVCNLLAELGVRGASVLVASGDDGVGDGKCLVDNGSGIKYVRFLPTFPSTCTCGVFFSPARSTQRLALIAHHTVHAGPWVTSVGGTTGFNPEVAAGLSGGGFSDYFPRERYQKYAVPIYLQFLGNQYYGLYKSVRYP